MVSLYSTENYTQHPMRNHNGKEHLKKNAYIYVHNWITLLYSRHEHNIVNQLWKWKCELLSHFQPCATPWTVAHQAPLSMLEWIAMPFSRGSSWPRDWTGVSSIAGRFLTVCTINYISIKKWTKKQKQTTKQNEQKIKDGTPRTTGNHLHLVCGRNTQASFSE